MLFWKKNKLSFCSFVWRSEVVKCTYENKVFYVQVQKDDVSKIRE